MVNLSALTDLQALEINTSLLNNATTEIIPVMQQTANSSSDGWYTLGVLLLFFIFILIITLKINGDIRLSIAQGIMVSSGFTSVLGILMLVLDYSNTITPFLWFFLIFILSILGLQKLKSNLQA